MNACRKKPAAPLHPIPVPKKKWSLVGMDIIGPLQVTDRGNQYIVALTDHFTKFPVAKAIPCKSSEEVARFMYETICIFGAFDSLITDQGREFINFALDILTDRFNINHRISSAYHPETNGQRERDNRTLKDTLVKITDNDDWDELLPAALFAYRTSVHKSTQFSPFLALYGEQAKLPFDVTGDANEQDLNEEIMDTMKGIHEEVKNKIGENISRAQKKQKEYYDSRRAYDHGFRIGDKVLIINAARVHRMGGKMAPRFVGPYEVISVLPKGRLQLKNTKTLPPEAFGVDMDKLLEKWQIEILWAATVALFVFFGMIGAFSSAKVADYFGRKKGMIIITFIMFIAAVLGGITILAKAPELLMLSRVFVGMHSGLNISLCPLYLAEISPKKIRGAIGTCHQLAITIGILFAQILGLRELLGTESLWPLLFAFNAVPSILCLVAMPFCPESPRFLLIKQGKEEEARKGHATMVMSYSTFIFAQAKVPEEFIGYIILGTGTINVLCTVIAVPLMEKAGRRPLLLWPMCVMTISFIFMTIFLNLMNRHPSLEEPRAAAMSLSLAFNWICNFILMLVFPFMKDGLEEYT
nr:hypothetical protein BaRGS_005298 [Batillaria attramentaria]